MWSEAREVAAVGGRRLLQSLAHLLNRRAAKLWSLIVDSRVEGADFDEACPSVARTHLSKNTAASWLLIYIRQDWAAANWLVSFRTLAVAALILATLMVPYVYGKLVASLYLSSVQLQVDSKSQLGVNLLRPAETLLVSANDHTVLVLYYPQETVRLLEIPREEVLYLQILDTKDFLAELVEAGKNKPRAPGSLKGN